MNFDFSGKTVVITGAGSGLGRACSRKFAAAGANLCLAGRTAAKLEETRAELDLGENACIVVPGALTDRTSCARVIDAALARFSRIDILCNVAADVNFRPFHEVDQEQWDSLVASNLTAPFFLMQCAMPHILATSGNIVNVSSTGGAMGQAYLAAYTATKFGLVGMTRSLAMEFMKQPVRINVLAPGLMATEMSEGVVLPPEFDMDLASRYLGLRPAASPDAVADVLLFLSSSQAQTIHGAVVAADGGITAG